MKKLMLVIALFVVSNASFSQKSKSKTIYRNSIYNIILTEYKQFDNKDSLIDVSYGLTVRNNTYTHLVDLFTVQMGTLDEIYDFVNECNVFLTKEEKGTGSIIGKNHVYVDSMYGAKYIMIYGYDEDENKYCNFMPVNFRKLTESIEDYSTVNNIKISR